MHTYVYLCLNLSIYLSIYLSLSLSICIYIHTYIYIYGYKYICVASMLNVSNLYKTIELRSLILISSTQERTGIGTRLSS